MWLFKGHFNLNLIFIPVFYSLDILYLAQITPNDSTSRKKTPPNPPKNPAKLSTSPPRTNKDTQKTPSIFHPLFENSIFYLYINIKSRSLCSKILKNKIKHFTVYPVWFLSWNNLKKSLAPMFILTYHNQNYIHLPVASWVTWHDFTSFLHKI